MWLELPDLGHAAAHLSRRQVGPISLLVPCVALVFARLAGVGEPVGGLRPIGIISWCWPASPSASSPR